MSRLYATFTIEASGELLHHLAHLCTTSLRIGQDSFPEGVKIELENLASQCRAEIQHLLAERLPRIDHEDLL
jgi:hypothetical protein